MTELLLHDKSYCIGLSIQQPWAYLIVAGIKDIENRSWKSSYRGKILVHASSKWDAYGWDYLLNKSNLLTISQIEACREAFNVRKQIIGEVEITNCVTSSESPWFSGKYGFTLVNPVQYAAEQRFEMPGQLSFFMVDIARKSIVHPGDDIRKMVWR